MTFREEYLVGDFVRMLVRDFDVVDLFHELVVSSTHLLDAVAAGLLLADEGSLRVAAPSSEAAHVVALLDLQSGGGAEAFLLSEPAHWDAAAVPQSGQIERWPGFAKAAQKAGFSAATAVPMRLRDKVLEAITVFRDSGPVSGADLVVMQALADLATIAILEDRSRIDDRAVISQLQTALDT